MKHILISALILIGVQSVFAAPTVTVNGQCVKEVAPDRFYIIMTARVIEKEAGAAAKKVTAQYEEIRKEVKKMSLKDVKLQTANYSVNAEWDYSNNKRVMRGFSASMGLRVETSEMTKAGELLVLSGKLGVQDVSSPVTFLSTALSQKENEECLQVAVKSALGKAEKMAAAAGMKIAGLLNLNESGRDNAPVPMYAMAESSMAKSGGQQMNFEIAPLTVNVVISATYNLK
jgi:uncharacterized protein YggE